MGASEDWALLANSYDKTLMRNRITFWLGEQMGFEFTPRQVPVDLVMVGSQSGVHAYGSYCLCETVKVTVAKKSPSPGSKGSDKGDDTDGDKDDGGSDKGGSSGTGGNGSGPSIDGGGSGGSAKGSNSGGGTNNSSNTSGSGTTTSNSTTTTSTTTSNTSDTSANASGASERATLPRSGDKSSGAVVWFVIAAAGAFLLAGVSLSTGRAVKSNASEAQD